MSDPPTTKRSDRPWGPHATYNYLCNYKVSKFSSRCVVEASITRVFRLPCFALHCHFVRTNDFSFLFFSVSYNYFLLVSAMVQDCDGHAVKSIRELSVSYSVTAVGQPDDSLKGGSRIYYTLTTKADYLLPFLSLRNIFFI